MNTWIDVEDLGGNKIGDGPIITASDISCTDRMDRAGVFSFKMPASDPRSTFLKHKRIVKFIYRQDETTYEAGSGIIDKIIPSVTSNGETILTVSGDNLLRELANRSVGFLNLSDGSGNGVTNSISQVLSFNSTWSIDSSCGTSEPEGNVYGAFAGETILTALNTISSQKGEHFRKQAGRKIAWLGRNLTQSGVRAISGGDGIALEGNRNACIIEEIEETQDAYNIVTRLYPYGAGTGEARLTLKACDKSAPSGYTLDKTNNCLVNDAAELVYGRIDKYLSFKDASPISSTDIDMTSAANALFAAGIEYLRTHGQIEKFYSIKVAKLAHQLLPGDTIHVIYTRIVDGYTAVDIDAELIVLEVTTSINESGIVTNKIMVSTIDRWPETEGALIASQLAEGRTFESHPQLNANAYTVSYREPMDNTHPAQMDFWLGSEVVNVVQVALRFRIDPLRSTVKSVSSQESTSVGGGGGVNTSDGGTGSGSTSLAGGGGGVTSLGGGGGYLAGVMYLTDSTAGYPVYYSNNGLRCFGGGSVTPSVSPADHTHGVSYGTHSHGINYLSHSHKVTIGTHTHKYTPSVSLVYGIFEGSTPLAETDLIYKVNGGSPIGRATSIGGGWYEIDLTTRVTNGLNNRPVRTDNNITISSSTANSATLSGQLVVRTTIQAIAIL